jgi:hypothetical protein
MSVKWPIGFRGLRPKVYRGGRPRKVKPARPAPAPGHPVALSGSARFSGSSTLACGLSVRRKLRSGAIDAFEHRARRREGVRCYYVPVSEQTILTMIRRRLISLEDSFIRRRSGALSAFFFRCSALCPLPITHAQRATRRRT